LGPEWVRQLDAAKALGEAIGAARVVAGRVIHEANARVEREPRVQVGSPEERQAVGIVVVAALTVLSALKGFARALDGAGRRGGDHQGQEHGEDDRGWHSHVTYLLGSGTKYG